MTTPVEKTPPSTHEQHEARRNGGGFREGIDRNRQFSDLVQSQEPSPEEPGTRGKTILPKMQDFERRVGESGPIVKVTADGGTDKDSEQ